MITKKSTKKPKVNKDSVKVPAKGTVLANHKHFLAIMVLFVGVSLYALGSFGASNNSYIRKVLTDVTQSGEIIAVAEEPVVSRENPFVDLFDNHYSYEAVIALYYNGIISGYSDGTFKPDKKVNRAEFAKMLVEASDVDYAVLPAQDMSNCFKDVRDLPGDWFAPSVCAAKYKGWVNGYEKGDFAPNRNINKAEGLKIVLKAFGFQVPANESVQVMPYVDVKAGDWFVGVAEAAKTNKLINQSDIFVGDWQLTRADVAQVIYNAMKMKGLVKSPK